MKTPILADRQTVIEMIRDGHLGHGSAIPPDGKVALITRDATGRVCVGAIGWRNSMTRYLNP